MAEQQSIPETGVHWPLTGRRALMAELVDAIEGNNGAVLLAGDAGVGKSRLLEELGQQLIGEGRKVVRCSATAGTRQIPFALFAPVLEPEALEKTDAARLSAAIEETLTASSSSPSLVIIDDVNHADSASAGLVSRLIDHPGSVVAMTLRQSEPTNAVDAILAHRDLTTIEVAPLDRAATLELAESALGGPLEASTADELWRLTEGNALFLREAVLGALSAGLLEWNGRHWWATAGISRAGRLIDIVRSRQASLSDRARRVLELLAVAGEPVPMPMAEEAAEASAIAELEQAQLIGRSVSGRRELVWLTHPLYAELAAADLSPDDRRDSLERLIELYTDSGAQRASDLFALAEWQLELGSIGDMDQVIDAADRALMLFDVALAERLAAGAIEAGGGFRARLVLARAWCLGGRETDGLALLIELEAEADDDFETAEAIKARAFHLYFLLGRSEEAISLLERAAGQVDDPVEADRITMMRASFELYLGDFRAADAASTAIVEANRADEPTILTGLSLIAIATAFSGQRERCEQVTADAYRIAASLRSGAFETNLLTASVTIARLYAGDAVGAEEHCRTVQREAVDAGYPWLAHGLHRSLGPVLMLRGRTNEAIRVLEIAAKATGLSRTMPYGLAMLANAYVQADRLDDARSIIEQFDSGPVPGQRTAAGVIDQARARLLARTGALSLAVDTFLAASRTNDEIGHTYYAAQCLFDVARCGRADLAVDGLEEIVSRVDEPWLPALYLEHVRALINTDVDSLVSLARRYSDGGLWIFAAEANAEASRVADPGARSALWSAARDAWAHCDFPPTPALWRRPPNLTGREYEVASMAQRGLTSRAIAEVLSVSARTPDNQLSSVYQKLGITSRTELTARLLGQTLDD